MKFLLLTVALISIAISIVTSVEGGPTTYGGYDFIESVCTSDNQLCFYIRGTNYRVSSLSEAQAFCAKAGLNLIEIRNSAVQKFVDSIIQSMSNIFTYFVSINLQRIGNEWRWINGDLANTASVNETIGNDYQQAYLLRESEFSLRSGSEYSTNYYICQFQTKCSSLNYVAKLNEYPFNLTTKPNNCFINIMNSLSWTQAKWDCLARNGQLAMLDDNDVRALTDSGNSSSPNYRLFEKFATNAPYWIGLAKSYWAWAGGRDNSPVYENWDDGYPRYSDRTTYRCGYFQAVNGKNKWKDGMCNDSYLVICMKGGLDNNYIPVLPTIPTTTPPAFPPKRDNSSFPPSQSPSPTPASQNMSVSGTDPMISTKVFIGIVAALGALVVILLVSLIILIIKLYSRGINGATKNVKPTSHYEESLKDFSDVPLEKSEVSQSHVYVEPTSATSRTYDNARPENVTSGNYEHLRPVNFEKQEYFNRDSIASEAYSRDLTLT